MRKNIIKQSLLSALSSYSITEEDADMAAAAIMSAFPKGGKTKVIDDSQVVELARQGMSYRQVAKTLDISLGAVGKIAKENGVDRGGQHHKPVQWTDEMRTTLRGMWAAHVSASLIGKRLGLTKQSVYKECARLGLTGSIHNRHKSRRAA